MRDLQPALQSSVGRSQNWSGAELINCFSEKADGDKLKDFALIASPGLELWATVGAGPIRGRIVCGGVLYLVSGGTLYSVDSAGASTAMGAIGGTGPVSIAANYSEVAVAANGTGYVLTAGVLTSPVPFDVSNVIYADGYLIWNIADSEQFIISALDNAALYDAADIASVEGFPDNLVGAINDHREIQFYGTVSTEIFYNSGGLFPFERQGNAFIERGCFDRDSIVKLDNSVSFMGDDRIIYVLNGYIPQRVSTHTIEYYLRDATYGRAWTYTQEGHKFYVLEVDRGTFLYDHATGAWHQRKSYGSDFWRCNGAIDAYGMTLLTNRETGAIYTASQDVLTEDGDALDVQITLPTIENRRDRVIMHAFEVTIESGQGTLDLEPQIVLTYSDDGGHRWSNEMWRSAGGAGEYRRRLVWRGLGQFRTRQLKLRMTDPYYKLVIAYWADMS